MSAGAEMRQTTCERCLRRFGCGGATGSCWCMDIPIDTGARARIASEFTDCLCSDCLAEVAREAASS